MNVSEDWLSGYVPLRSIDAVVAVDQAGREVIWLYALDHSGRAWERPEGGEWRRVGNPTVEKTPLSTPE